MTKSDVGTTWMLSGLQIRKPRIFEEGACRADFPKLYVMRPARYCASDSRRNADIRGVINIAECRGDDELVENRRQGPTR